LGSAAGSYRMPGHAIGKSSALAMRVVMRKQESRRQALSAKQVVLT